MYGMVPNETLVRRDVEHSCLYTKLFTDYTGVGLWRGAHINRG